MRSVEAGQSVGVHRRRHSLQRRFRGPADAMRKAAETLKNRPISEKAFVELVVTIHKLVPAESGGMVIALDRDGDDTGIQLEIRVLPRRDPPKGGAVHLRRHEEVVVDGQEILSSGSTTVGIGQETRSEWDSAEWKGLVSSLQKSLELAARPKNSFKFASKSLGADEFRMAPGFLANSPCCAGGAVDNPADVTHFL